jgi:hypothetical protein
MSDQSPLTADAVDVFIASLRQRSVPVNTIKSYAHDLHLFVQSVPADLPTVTRLDLAPKHVVANATMSRGPLIATNGSMRSRNWSAAGNTNRARLWLAGRPG